VAAAAQAWLLPTQDPLLLLLLLLAPLDPP
jgi:hypothetical protein